MGVVTDMTDRKRADEERQALSRKLEESNARLEESQRVAHLGYWIWNLDTNRVVFSNETCRIYGINQQEDPIDLEAIRELIHPEDRGYVFENAERSVRDKVPIETEHRLIRPSGEIRIVYSRGALTKDAAGRPYEMFGTCQDITERKLAEQALRRSQFYLSEGERLAHIGSWASSDLGISLSEDLGLYWSDEVYKIFGLAPEKGPPRLEQFLAAIHPQDRASMAETIKTVHEQRCGCDVTKRIVRPDGEIRYVRCVGIPVVDDGVFQGFRGTTIDVTAQELLTQELRREQAYLAEAQSLAHIGSWASNLETGEVHHRSEVREGVDYDIQGFRICRAGDGQIRFLRTVGHRNPAGESGEYFGVTMDITELKRAEEERERLRQLEADIAHINRVNMMGELAAALAHEIKQPIAAAITSASACLRWLGHVPPDVERACAAAARIEQEGNRAADIIDSLRSFYKTGTPAERQWVDVKGTVREMSALLRTEAARYSVTIRTEFEVDPLHILVDRVQLQQVLMNLMLNAIEAMKDTGGGNVTIRSGVNREGHVTVSISDTGIGLPAEGPDLIFDPFHTTKPQGTGMGLTITRSIVESYGGRVWATTNQGPGATFYFTLPTRAEAHA